MRILIATGGSGGHIFPALHVAEKLKAGGHEVTFVTTPGKVTQAIVGRGFPVRMISSRGFSLKSPASFFMSLGCMGIALVQSLKILIAVKPQRVVGFGGYGAFPVVLMGALIKRPTLIHEQNVIPGRANRVLAKFAGRIALSFRESEKYFPSEKTVFTGCPCRMRTAGLNKESLFKKFGLESSRVTILVLGGSQGSRRINTEFLAAAPLLKNEIAFQAIHVSGESGYPSLKEQYARLKIPHHLSDFLNNIDEAYEIADLVISRSGAVTVCEIAAFSLAAILIPYPYAGGHQKENAKILEKEKTACMIEENNLSAEVLKNTVLKILKENMSKDEIARRLAHVIAFDSAQKIAHEIETLTPQP